MTCTRSEGACCARTQWMKSNSPAIAHDCTAAPALPGDDVSEHDACDLACSDGAGFDLGAIFDVAADAEGAEGLVHIDAGAIHDRAFDAEGGEVSAGVEERRAEHAADG